MRFLTDIDWPVNLAQLGGVTAKLNYPHIALDEDGTSRLERLPRIRVSQLIADHLAYGWDADAICRQYSHLHPAEVHSAFAYYFDHVESIESEIESELTRLEKHARNESSPLRLRLKKLRSA